MEANLIEKIHQMDKAQGVTAARVENLEKSEGHLWKAVSEIRADVGRIKVEVGKVVAIVGIIQIIATGIIVWSLTKGKEEKHAARQVHQTEVRNVVGGPLSAPSWRPD